MSVFALRLKPRTIHKFVEQNKRSCSIPCNLCGFQNVEELSLVDREQQYLRTVICKECGLVWTDPRPVDVRHFYEKAYRIHYKRTSIPKLKHIYRAGKAAKNQFSTIKNFLHDNAMIVDVGSGGGEFVYLLTKLGYDARGIEPNHGYATYSIKEYGLKVDVGFVQDIEVENNTCNTITMFHVLEHTEEPFQILSYLRKWLKPGGHVVIEIPNVEAVCQAPGHRFHVAHLYYFNRKTLELLGRKAGYTVQEVSVSEDGGNILMIFQKSDQHIPLQDAKIPGNYQRICHIIRTHTNFAHYTSLYPYFRPMKRLYRAIDEWRAIKAFSTGKQILDAMYSLDT